MQEEPLVSIIIPTYNRAHIIGETLDSVLDQTYINWECIVVDDGSTDDTDALMQKYCKRDLRFRFLRRPKQRKRGGNAARNFGFENCRGEFVNFLDSDDLINSKKLEHQISILLKNKNCQVCLCEAEIFNEVKRYQKKSKPLDEINFFEDYILRNIDMGTTQPLWRKSFLASAEKIYDENLLKAQDFDFLSRMSFRKDFSHCAIKEIFVYVRTGNSGRITDLKPTKNVLVSYLNAYYNTYLLLVGGCKDEKLYKKYTNMFLGHILKAINAKYFTVVFSLLKKMESQVFENRFTYKIHFFKIRSLVKMLRLTNLRGYSVFKKFYYLK